VHLLKRYLLVWLQLVGFYSLSSPLLLSDPNASYFTYELKPEHCQVAIDYSGTLTISQVLDGEIGFRDTVLPTRFKNENEAVWIKFTLRNTSDKISQWVFIQGDPTVGGMSFFCPDKNGQYSHANVSGLGEEFSNRAIKMASLAYPFTLQQGESKTFYLRIQSDYMFMLKMVVQDYEFAFNYYLSEYYFLGFYYGMLLLMALYNLVLFFSIRTRVYFFYVLYVLATALVNSMNDKTLFQFFWPEWPMLNSLLFTFGQAFLVISLTAYATNFLPIKQYFPKAYTFVLLYAATITLAVILESIFIGQGYGGYFVLSHLLLIYGYSLLSMRKGFRPARFFVLGFSFVFLGMGIFYMATLGFLTANILTVYSYNMGMVAEIIVLSSALGDRFRFLKKEQEDADKKLIEQLKENERQLIINEELKTKVNRELEEKVKERTLLIEQQTEEIHRMNLLLQADNKNLVQDVKKISQSKLMQEDVLFEEFVKIYPDDASCLKLLDEQKWKSGFVCRKCHNTNYSKANTPYARKCTRCKTIETATAHTILHGVKFPLNKALYLLVCTVNNTNKYTLDQISEMISLRRVTCWSFQNKVKQCIAEYEASKRGKLNWLKLMLMNPHSIGSDKDFE
jgi:hypothetical protein